MPPATKQALGKLRREMEEAGCTPAVIAQEMQRGFALRPREAHRHARGWSQDDAAHAVNAGEASGSATMTAARISAYERWPVSGERPSPRALVALARTYGVQVADLLDYRDIQATPAADRQVLDSLAGIPDRPAPHVPADAPPRADTPPSGLRLTDPDETHLAESARQSAAFARRAGQTNVGPTDLDQLDADVDSIARRYLVEPLVPLITDMVRARNAAWELLEGRQYPAQTNHLYVVAAQTCGLLASASCDLGYYDAADTHARTAALCAELSGHDKLRAWIANTRSLIAFWGGRTKRAAEYAAEAAHHARDGVELARAYSYRARATARLGNEDGTRAAIEAAVDARMRADDEDDYRGLFAFPLANQQRCAGSSLVWTGHVHDGVVHLEDALAGYAQTSYAHASVTRLDLVLARLHEGDLDAARETIAPVLALPAELRLAGVTRRTEGLQRLLTGAGLRGTAAALALADEISDFLEHHAARALPAPPT